MGKYFKAYGLAIKSEVPFCLLPLENDIVDVNIRYGQVKDEPQYLTRDHVQYSHLANDSCIIQWPRIGKVQINFGSEIIIDALEDCSIETVRLPLLGTVMSVILWQRNYTVLHGSSIRKIGGEALVFLGEKGQGKSTIAAWLNKHEYSVITDDICALQYGREPDRIVIHPAYPLMKLSPEALRLLDSDPEEYPKVHPKVDKRFVDIKRFSEGKQNVAAILILETGKDLILEKLVGMAAMQEILKHMMLNRFLEGQTEELRKKAFADAIQIVKTVPVYRLVRPRDLELLPKTLKLLEETFFKKDSEMVS